MMSTESTISAIQPSARFKISETILKTGRLDAMKTWYRTVLEVEPFFEHAPSPDTRPADYGGQTRASDLRMCFFRLSLDYPHTQTIGLFEEPGTSLEPATGKPGLHHMQLMCDSLDRLCDEYDRLVGEGMRPHRSADHGPMTSFYYRDPDGNNVELTAQNFPTVEAMVEFMESDAFKANPSGTELEPEAFVTARREKAADSRSTSAEPIR